MKKIFVHRFKWGHDKRRKKYKKLFKEGKVKILERTHDGWLYGHIEDKTIQSV